MKIEPYVEGMPEPKDFNIRGKEVIDLPWGGNSYFTTALWGCDRYAVHSIYSKRRDGKNGRRTNYRVHVRDVRVMVFDGKMHRRGFERYSFKIAGMMAFKDAFMKSEPQLLEPIYDLEMMVPEDVMGEVMGDLQTRRALIMGMDSKG